MQDLIIRNPYDVRCPECLARVERLIAVDSFVVLVPCQHEVASVSYSDRAVEEQGPQRGHPIYDDRD
ncbi:hypothetical protein [Kribbella deserti]|uniref:Uncharacterized protein n=1 Tax=Kribbella deserti TaxID=1926257 RepID=A0ABV6QFH5_9ACTN